MSDWVVVTYFPVKHLGGFLSTLQIAIAYFGLGAVRLPFLFQEFDAQAEQTSLAILGRLGRFSGSEDFSEDAVIDVVLNEGLRSRIGRGQPEDEEIELVRDAYIAQVQRQLEQDRAANQRRIELLKDQDTELSNLRRERAMTTEKTRTIRDELQSKRAMLDERDRDLSDLKDSHSKLTEKFEQGRRTSERLKALAAYIAVSASCVIVSGFWGLLSPRVYPLVYNELGSPIA